MMYKVGDEVLVKAKITNIGGISATYYNVKFGCSDTALVSEKEVVADKTYEQGSADAWKLAKKLFAEYKDSELCEIFGKGWSYPKLMEFTYEEALAKIEAYEKEKEIKVGDVLLDDTDLNSYAIATRVDGDVLYTMCSDGSCGREMYPGYFKKTGKHIDIESLLRQIGE